MSEVRFWVYSANFLFALLRVFNPFNPFQVLASIMHRNSKRTLRIHPQNRESHIDLGLLGRGQNHQIQESSNPPRNLTKTTKQEAMARDTSAQDGASQPKETHTSIGEQHVSSGFPQTIGGDQERSSIKHDDPWKTYEKGYDLKLDQFVTVATRKAPLHGKVAIKVFRGREANRKLDMLHRICHERFVSLLEVFEFQKTWYAVFEHVVISLTQVVNSPAYPTERQLAAIVGQVSLKRGSVLYAIANESRFSRALLTWPQKDCNTAR